MNNERLFPSISRSFSSPLPSILLFPPSGYRHATSGQVQRTRDDVTPPRWEFIIWSSLFNDPRFFRVHRGFERVLDLVSSRFPRRAVIMRSRMTYPLTAMGFSRWTFLARDTRIATVRAGACALYANISYRLAFVTAISGTWTIKNRGYRIIIF